MSTRAESLPHRILLIVEDDLASRKFLRLILEKKNFSIIEAVTGEEALALMDGQNVDGLLLDIALGAGLSGLDLGSTLKEDLVDAKVPMIAITAFDRDSLGDIDARGFTGYVQKPYHPQDLWSILDQQVPAK